MTANLKVREDIGKVAFMRGPICYCAEEIDNGRNLHLLRVDKGRLGEITIEKTNELGHDMIILKVPGKKLPDTTTEEALYSEYVPLAETPVTITLVPYYAWNNRGEGEMSVWLR